jgi:LysR family glycine cleavage system transcriptional activator
MTGPLPNLSALRAFEAAARLLSFTKAAAELNVTPAAISQRIRQLEERYGAPLFARTTRSLSLTPTGGAIRPLVRDGFAAFEEVHARLSAERDGGTLTVSLYPTFAEKWLIPRLESFRSAYPDIDLRIHATDDFVDFRRDGVDIAIRYGTGEYPGLVVIPLMEEPAVPVCAPEIARTLRAPEDLANHTLLHAEWRMDREAGANWRAWLKAARVTEVDPTRGLRFNTEAMTVQAAIDGLGVALTPRPLVARDIREGRLARPFGDRLDVPTEFRDYIVYPPAAESVPKVAAFRDWALEAATLP